MTILSLLYFKRYFQTVMPAQIYLGDIPSDCRERDVEDFFRKYGRIEKISMKGILAPAPDSPPALDNVIKNIINTSPMLSRRASLSNGIVHPLFSYKGFLISEFSSGELDS